MAEFTESVVEDAALAWLEGLGYAVLHGPEIVAGMPGAERIDPNYRDVLLEDRLRPVLVRLNPDLSPEALEDAYRKLTRADAPSLVKRNRAVHRMLVDGVTVEYRRASDWLAVNQFTVREGQHTRRRTSTPGTAGTRPSSRFRRCKCWADGSARGSWVWWLNGPCSIARSCWRTGDWRARARR